MSKRIDHLKATVFRGRWNKRRLSLVMWAVPGSCLLPQRHLVAQYFSCLNGRVMDAALNDFGSTKCWKIEKSLKFCFEKYSCFHEARENEPRGSSCERNNTKAWPPFAIVVFWFVLCTQLERIRTAAAAITAERIASQVVTTTTPVPTCYTNKFWEFLGSSQMLRNAWINKASSRQTNIAKLFKPSMLLLDDAFVCNVDAC